MRILMIMAAEETSPATRRPNVAHLTHFVGAYYVLRDAGAEIAMASRAGGAPFVSKLDDDAALPMELRERFNGDRLVHDEIADTLCLDQVCQTDFGAVFCVGLPCADRGLPSDDPVLVSIKAFLASGKPVAVISSEPSMVHEAAGSGLLIIGASVGCSISAAHAVLGVLHATQAGDPE